MLKTLDEYRFLIDIIGFIAVALVVYFKDRNRAETNQVANEKDFKSVEKDFTTVEKTIDDVKADCQICQGDMEKRFIAVNAKINEIEKRQREDNSRIYDKMSEMETKITALVTSQMQMISNQINSTLQTLGNMIKDK